MKGQRKLELTDSIGAGSKPNLNMNAGQAKTFLVGIEESLAAHRQRLAEATAGRDALRLTAKNMNANIRRLEAELEELSRLIGALAEAPRPPPAPPEPVPVDNSAYAVDDDFAAPGGFASAAALPEAPEAPAQRCADLLSLVAPSHEACEGFYKLCQGMTHNDYPVWIQTDGPHYLFACNTGMLLLRESAPLAEDIEDYTDGIIASIYSHDGAMPNEMHDWQFAGVDEEWQDDPSIGFYLLGKEEEEACGRNTLRIGSKEAFARVSSRTGSKQEVGDLQMMPADDWAPSPFALDDPRLQVGSDVFSATTSNEDPDSPTGARRKTSDTGTGRWLLSDGILKGLSAADQKPAQAKPSRASTEETGPATARKSSEPMRRPSGTSSFGEARRNSEEFSIADLPKLGSLRGLSKDRNDEGSGASDEDEEGSGLNESESTEGEFEQPVRRSVTLYTLPDPADFLTEKARRSITALF